MLSLTNNNCFRISSTQGADRAAALSMPTVDPVDPEPGSEISLLRSRATSTYSTISNENKHDIIDVDLFEDILREKKSAGTCKGYALVFPEGKSPYSCYPFALHDTLILPWDFKVQNGMMTLFARNCTGQVAVEASPCQACQRLVKNQTLEGIHTRIDEGVQENSAFAYHGFSGLEVMLQRKNRRIEFYRMRGLNQAKKLLSKATALLDHKRLLMAIASGKISRVDHLISIGLRQRKGIRGLVALYMAAAEGVYHPKSFTEEEDMKNLLLWRLSGNRVAEINHRANGAQSVSYLRRRSTIPPLIPSHGQPTIEQVQHNVEATLEGVLDVIHSQTVSKTIHAIVMFDELATEKRIRWDPKSNYFLGVCREHAHKTSMEFINEGDMDELFRKLDDGEIHYAGEVRMFQFASVSNLLPFGPYISILGNCRRSRYFVKRSSNISWSACSRIWRLQV